MCAERSGCSTTPHENDRISISSLWFTFVDSPAMVSSFRNMTRASASRGDPQAPARLSTYPAGVDPRRRTIALLALTLGVFLVTLNVTIIVVALPEIARDLDTGADTTAWIIDSYNLVGASLLLSAGYFADRFGRRRILVIGYVLFAGGALLCAVAPNIGWLLAFRLLQAVGGTALTPTSLAIVANLYPDPRERAKAIGIWGITSGIGLGLGPIIGGAVVDGFGWRMVFAVNAAIGLAALVAVLKVVPPRAARSPGVSTCRGSCSPWPSSRRSPSR